jgi:hypothetical protein
MNSLREKAETLDEQEDYIGCAEAYEQLLTSGKASTSDLIALGLVYFEACDGGIAAARRLPIEFERHAGSRLQEVLREAVTLDPSNCEARFWEMYCRSILLAEWNKRAFDDLFESPDYRCGGAFVTMWKLTYDDDTAVADAESILEDPALRKSSMGRTIASQLRAALTRRRLRDI